MNNPKFELKRSNDKQFYFNLKAGNGEIIISSSEMYTTKQSCENGIDSVKDNARHSDQYERRNGSNYTFVLKAANGRIIGRSESYTSAAGRDNGIQAVKRDAPDAPVDDQA